MIKCLNCGKDTANGMLCNECMTNADIESFVSNYTLSTLM